MNEPEGRVILMAGSTPSSKLKNHICQETHGQQRGHVWQYIKLERRSKIMNKYIQDLVGYYYAVCGVQTYTVGFPNACFSDFDK